MSISNWLYGWSSYCLKFKQLISMGWRVRNSKFVLGTLAVASMVGFAGPAAAIPLTWSGPFSVHTNALDFTMGTGTLSPGVHLNIHGSSLAVNKSIEYAGPLSVTINTIPPSNPPNTVPTIVFCDDLAQTILVNHTYNNFFASDPAAPADVFHYLNTTTLKADEILGLVARGTLDADTNLLTPELGAAFQMAIWELEYGGTATFSGDPNFQSVIDNLIAGAAADYAFFTSSANFSVPWTFSQLEAPCNTANVGLVTKDAPQGPTIGETVNPNCQKEQGLIVAIPGVPLRNVPEPITLSLFGSGLAGVAAYRRRRKTAA